MFLIDAIKPNVENKLNIVLISMRRFRGGESQNKTSFVSFRVRFIGGNKNIIQKKRENI